MSQMFWVKWQERSDRKKNPGMFHIARTTSMEAALAVYCSLRNDNAMLSVTVGYTVPGVKDMKTEEGVSFQGITTVDHIVKEYVA